MNLEEIKELRELRKEKANLIQKEKKLTDPVLDDLSLIPKIYEWFLDINGDKSCNNLYENVFQKKKFVFIVISLYCPKCFNYAKMPNGVRNALNGIFKYKYASRISELTSESINLFLLYKRYRLDIQESYNKILIRLKTDGYV